MTTVLVTGGCGFIGSNFIRQMLANDPVVNLDRLTYAGNLDNLRDVQTIRATSSSAVTSATSG